MKQSLSCYLLGVCLTLLVACTDQPPPNTTTTEQPVAKAPLSPADSLKLAGKTLFYANCASCHAICAQVIGPELTGVTKKHKKEWLYAFTRNSQEMIKKGDHEAVKIYKAFNKIPMLSFPSLSDGELDAIYTFIEGQPCPEPPIQTDVAIP